MKLFTREESKKARQSNLEAIREKESKATKALADKLKKLNEINEVYPVKLVEKQKELAEVELRLKTFLANEGKEVAYLEERRKQALAPIITEIETLETARSSLQAHLLSLNEKKLEIEKAEGRLRLKENEIQIAEHSLSVFKQETTNFIERQKLQAKALIASSEVALAALKRERENTEVLIKRAEVKQRSAERAETIAKAAMVAADQRVELERLEQRKIDDKRKMLKIAINVAKQKGVWPTDNEIKIK